MTNGKHTINKHKTPLTFAQIYSKYKIMKNLTRTLSLFSLFSENNYKSKTLIIVTELCGDMMYNANKWQSVNETNQESNQYLQLCRSTTNCQYSVHCLLEAVYYLTF